MFDAQKYSFSSHPVKCKVSLIRNNSSRDKGERPKYARSTRRVFNNFATFVLYCIVFYWGLKIQCNTFSALYFEARSKTIICTTTQRWLQSFWKRLSFGPLLSWQTLYLQNHPGGEKKCWKSKKKIKRKKLPTVPDIQTCSSSPTLLQNAHHLLASHSRMLSAKSMFKGRQKSIYFYVSTNLGEQNDNIISCPNIKEPWNHF